MHDKDPRGVSEADRGRERAPKSPARRHAQPHTPQVHGRRPTRSSRPPALSPQGTVLVMPPEVIEVRTIVQSQPPAAPPRLPPRRPRSVRAELDRLTDENAKLSDRVANNEAAAARERARQALDKFHGAMARSDHYVAMPAPSTMGETLGWLVLDITVDIVSGGIAGKVAKRVSEMPRLTKHVSTAVSGEAVSTGIEGLASRARDKLHAEGSGGRSDAALEATAAAVIRDHPELAKRQKDEHGKPEPLRGWFRRVWREALEANPPADLTDDQWYVMFALSWLRMQQRSSGTPAVVVELTTPVPLSSVSAVDRLRRDEVRVSLPQEAAEYLEVAMSGTGLRDYEWQLKLVLSGPGRLNDRVSFDYDPSESPWMLIWWLSNRSLGPGHGERVASPWAVEWQLPVIEALLDRPIVKFRWLE